MRRVWIIDKDKKVTTQVKADAKLNNCPEIAVGIPPIFKGKVGALPCIYEEPDLPQPEEPRGILDIIGKLDKRIELLEKK